MKLDEALSLSKYGRAITPLLILGQNVGYLRAIRANDGNHLVSFVGQGEKPQLSRMQQFSDLSNILKSLYESQAWEPKHPKSALELLAEQSDETS